MMSVVFYDVNNKILNQIILETLALREAILEIIF